MEDRIEGMQRSEMEGMPEGKMGDKMEGMPENKTGDNPNNRRKDKRGGGMKDKMEAGKRDKPTERMKNSPGQSQVLERFVHTLNEQDDTAFLLKRIVRWMCFFASVFVLGFTIEEWTPRIMLMGMNAFFVGMLSMIYTLDSSVTMRRGVVLNLYECLKYFPVGRLEIYHFLRKKLLRFLGLYGGTAVLLRLITGVLTHSLGPDSLLLSLIVWLMLALVGFSVIRVRMAWRYKKQVRSL